MITHVVANYFQSRGFKLPGDDEEEDEDEEGGDEQMTGEINEELEAFYDEDLVRQVFKQANDALGYHLTSVRLHHRAAPNEKGDVGVTLEVRVTD
jgi:hypothetical protein